MLVRGCGVMFQNVDFEETGRHWDNSWSGKIEFGKDRHGTTFKIEWEGDPRKSLFMKPVLVEVIETLTDSEKYEEDYDMPEEQRGRWRHTAYGALRVLAGLIDSFGGFGEENNDGGLYFTTSFRRD